MFVLRLLGLLVVVGAVIGVGAYALTGQRKYLDFAFRLGRYALVLALLLFALLALERFAVIVI